MLAFLIPILSPEKPYNITLILATTLLIAYSEKKVVNWGSIIGELVHRLATNTKREQSSYIGHFFFHLYAHENLLTDEEEIQWTGHQIIRELQTTDSEPEMGQEYSKGEDAADFSNEERPVSKKRKSMLENLATHQVRCQARWRWNLHLHLGGQSGGFHYPRPEGSTVPDCGV